MALLEALAPPLEAKAVPLGWTDFLGQRPSATESPAPLPRGERPSRVSDQVRVPAKLLGGRADGDISWPEPIGASR